MPLPGLPPEQRRLLDFMEALPQCPHGCHFGYVYNSPTFRVPSADDTIDGQVAEIIERYEQEAPAMLLRHFRDQHPLDWPALAMALEAKTRFETSMQRLTSQVAAAPADVQRIRAAILAIGEAQR